MELHDFDIQYHRGTSNVVTDVLSRQSVEEFNSIVTRNSANVGCSWIDRRMKEAQVDPQKFPDFTIINDYLHRHLPKSSAEEGDMEIVYANTSEKQGSEENHDQPIAGHLDIRKTTNRVCSRYYWPGMLRDICRYVRNCVSCQQCKSLPQKFAREMLTVIPKKPLATICSDLIGSLARTKSSHTMLLVFMDQFSNGVELIPVRLATTIVITNAFREHPQ